MKRIEVNTDIINVPESWDDITLGFYETWFDKAPQNRKEQIELVAEICKIDSATLLSYPVEVFNIVSDTLAFVFTESTTTPSPFIEIEGVKYIIPITETLTTGAWVDAEQAQKEDEHVLSSILAITCQRAGETYDTLRTEERQKMFAKLTMSKVLPLLGFFLHYKKVLESRSAMFLQVREVANQYVNSTVSFPSDGDGTKFWQIWPRVRFYIWTKYLKNRLRKSLRSLDTKQIADKPKGRKEILKNK